MHESKALPGQPERPIQSHEQDSLDRGGFVSKLVDALIQPKDHKSTGVVVGVTGPWGSGKSSILNMLAEKISERYPAAHVVRFDPWLVSGRNDLVSEFMSELLSTFKKSNAKEKEVAATLAKYGAMLAPAANFVNPLLGAAAQGGLNAVREALMQGESLSSLRRSLIGQLEKLDVPVVVLIDELDRVEDSEIRTVAQLVRSVADFPGISYAIAYDVDRVIQALGSGVANSEVAERGRSYLEKIVQFSFPLPIMFSEELHSLLTAELRALSASLSLPKDFELTEAYRNTLQVLTLCSISTPRDVKRLVGTFHVLGSMVGREVEWIDLLLFSSLMAKAPRTVEMIKESPDRYVRNPASTSDLLERILSDEAGKKDSLAGLIASDEATPAIRKLIKRIFPHLGDSGEKSQPDSLAVRRPLLTTLRLGLVPGSASRQQVEQLFDSEPSELAAALRKSLDEDRFAGLLDRIDDIYSTKLDMDHERFWIGVSQFLKRQHSGPDAVLLMRSLSENFYSLMRTATKRNEKFGEVAVSVTLALAEANDHALLPQWLHYHFFTYGLFDCREDGGHGWLSKEQTESLAERLTEQWSQEQLQDQLLPSVWDMHAHYATISAGKWTVDCQKKFAASLRDKNQFDSVMLMSFGDTVITAKEMLEKLGGPGIFEKRVARRERDSDVRDDVRNAMRKFSRRSR